MGTTENKVFVLRARRGVGQKLSEKCGGREAQTIRK